MIDTLPDSTQCPVELPAKDLKIMIQLVKALYRLHRNKSYIEPLLAQLPESARFDPGHDAVMMGYDFHLTPDGPRLIEVNTNAGGLMLAWQAHQKTSSIRPDSGSRPVSDLLDCFYQEMALFSNGRKKRPGRIVIIDAEPEKQFLYPEMQQFALLFKSRGIAADVVDPNQLQASADGVFLGGEPVDLIYNRHCDFYLESEPLAAIRKAYLAKAVCLSPNPRAYGLLADKRRMIIWSNEQALTDMGVEQSVKKKLLQIVPASHMLSEFDHDDFWQQRRQWVVKPVDSFGSRGVTLGKSMSRTRFAALPKEITMAQKLVPPSTTLCPWSDKPLKTDLRLFVYKDKVLGVTARIYQGQVTSFKEPGSGYAPVKVV
jgi:hypothetical protein